MRIWTTLLAVALAGATVPLTSSASYADDDKDEKVVTMDQIPAAAKQTIQREAAGSPILKVEQETDHGQTLYEAHVKKGNDVIGIRVDGTGKLIDRHSEKDEHE